MLIEMGVEYCILNDMRGHLDDYKAQSIITQSCSEEYQVQISDQFSAHSMWAHLMSLFVTKANGKLISLQEESRTFKMLANEKPSAYVLRARRIANTIKSLGHEFSDLSLCTMLLNGLPEEYAIHKQVQQSIIVSNPDVNLLQHSLELAYMQIVSKRVQHAPAKPETSEYKPSPSQGYIKAKTPDTPSSNNVEKGSNQGGGEQNGKAAFQQIGRPLPYCVYCKQQGHNIESCPKLEKKKVSFGALPSQSNCTQLYTVCSEPSLPGWLIDSGSSDHISPDCENMINYVKFDKPDVLIVANGGKEHIVGEGTVQVFLETGNSLFLYNVKHVPSAKKRLLSVGKAFHDGIDVHINGIQCHLTDSNGDLIGIAEHVYPYQWLTDLSIQDKHLSNDGLSDSADQMPNVFSASAPYVMCPALQLGQDATLVSAGEHKGKDQGQQGPDPVGTKHGKTAAAGSMDTSDPEPCYTSVAGPRPLKGVPQVTYHVLSGETVPGPQLETGLHQDSVLVPPAGGFSSMYPIRGCG
jgi:hypothetical protein